MAPEAVVGLSFGFPIHSMHLEYVLPDTSVRPRPKLCDIGGNTKLGDVCDANELPRSDKKVELLVVAMAGIVAEDVVLDLYPQSLIPEFRQKNRYAGDRNWVHQITNGHVTDKILNDGIVQCRPLLEKLKPRLLGRANILSYHIRFHGFRMPHQVPESQLQHLRELLG